MTNEMLNNPHQSKIKYDSLEAASKRVEAAKLRMNKRNTSGSGFSLLMKKKNSIQATRVGDVKSSPMFKIRLPNSTI